VYKHRIRKRRLRVREKKARYVARRRRGFGLRIVSDPNICGGDPCIVGTRIPVHVILSHLAAGDSPREILKNFPTLKKEDIQACLEFASYLSTEKAIPA
jgi:uncharacterized protein (DUF433 family)